MRRSCAAARRAIIRAPPFTPASSRGSRGRLTRCRDPLVPTTDRDAVGLMLQGLDGAIDVIVPRGGKSLVDRVQDEARVPVFAHLEGICHTYVDRAADLDMARTVLLNAKMRRTGVCGATECLLIDKAAPAAVLRDARQGLARGGLRGARRRGGRGRRPARQGGGARRLWPRVSRRHHRGEERRRRRRRDRAHRAATARSTPTPSLPPTRRRPSASSPASTARSSCGMPRRSSPTAGSSASAAKSASRRASSTRADPSASSS